MLQMSTIFTQLEMAIDHLLLTTHTAPHLISRYPCMHTVPLLTLWVPFYHFPSKGKELCSLYLTHTKEITFWSILQDYGES